MKSVRLIRLALALLAGSYSLQAQQPQKKTGLQIELLSFEDKKLEEGERPQPANAFVVGETAVLVTRLSGFGVKEDGSLDVEAGFTVQTPDGKRHPVKAAFAARPLEKAGQPVTILDPIFPFTFTPEYHPTGTYLIEVAVTDKVSRATAKKQIPLFAFLTEGSKELISHPTPDAPVTLDGTLLTPGFWDLSADEIAAAFWPIGLRWTSVDKTTMRSILRKATFQEREIADVQIRFENDLPAEVKLFVYNRGDQGLVTEEWFKTASESVIAEMTRWAEKRPEDLTPKTGGRPGQTTLILGWKGENSFLRMESAYSTVRNEDGRGRVFQPEYISLTMLPSGQRTKAEMAGRTRDNVTTVMLKQRVVRAPNGDVYLDVPMHDQGEKGYCAAAAVERLLDFYGSSVSQHEIAQRIQMGAEGATFEGILRGLRSLATMLRLQVRVIMESDDKVFMKWIDEYNKMAKRERKLPIDFDTIGKEYGPKTIWDAFDKDVFLKSRIRTPVPVNRFFEQCKQKIDNGIPLIQTCMIGILPEEAKLGQPPGGHARLIIGYNIAQKELLYTDSWGLGHERKRLPIDHTYAITTGLLTVEPR